MTARVIIPALNAAGTVHALSLLKGQCQAAIVIDNSTGEVGEALEHCEPWVTVLRPGRKPAES